MVAIALGLIATSAQGQARLGANAATQIEYDAPRACPDRAFFEAQLRARVAPELRDSLARLRIRASIELRANRARGRIQLGSAAGSATTPRRIEAASCREVVEGLALIAALSIAPPLDGPASGTRAATARERSSSAREAAPDAATNPRAASDDEPTAPDRVAGTREQAASARGSNARDVASSRPEAASDTRAATRGPSARDDASPRPQAASGTRAALPGSNARDDASPRSEAEGDPLHEASDREPAESERAAQPAAVEPAQSPGAEASRLSIAAGVILFQGLAPELQPGLQLGLGLRVATWAGLAWIVGLAGRLAFEQEAVAADGRALFDFLGGAASVCAAGPVVAALWLQACAVIEPGRLSADGRATRNPEGYQRAWVAFGGGVGALVQPLPALGAQLGAELLAPLRRDRYLLARDLVHRAPAVGLRLGVSIVWSPE